MRFFRITIATLTVFVPTVIAGLLTLLFYGWSKWAFAHWSWARESGPLWDHLADNYLPTLPGE